MGALKGNQRACRKTLGFRLRDLSQPMGARPDAVACSGALRAVAEGRQWPVAFGHWALGFPFSGRDIDRDIDINEIQL